VHVDAAADLTQRAQRVAGADIVATSTILKRRGGRGPAGSGARGLRLGGTNSGSVLAAGFRTTWSSGTISAPVPFVAVSSTQILPIAY
jgi:hypothetical protein